MIKRVLMTGDTVGGVWTYTLELAEALGGHGVEVVLAALGGPPSIEQRREAARIPNLDVLASDFKLEWMDNPWRDVEESGRWLLDLEEQYEPDIVHLNSYGHGALPWRAPVVLTAHSCVLSWWAAVKGSKAPESWDRYRDCVRQSLAAADVVTAPSRAMAAALEEYYGFGGCVAAPNGRCPTRFSRAVKEPFVLAAGRLWDEAKNVGAVARAAMSTAWPVYLAGEHRHPDGGSAEFPGCRMLGHLSPGSLAEWYARAAVFALPARYEPFGLSALEAALSGCALVLGDIPSLREIWGREAALFVDPEDLDALRAALNLLIQRPALRERYASEALRRAMEFTPRRMAEAYLGIYRPLAERRMPCAS